MLPEIAGVKTAVFTQRYAAYNETFSELGRGKSFGVLWHQAMMGRNDEDITSAFMKILQSPDVNKHPHIVIWLDNCSGQNKNWTIFTTLACFMGEVDESCASLKSVTLKYFEAGHTFMAADSFHARVEKQFRKKKNIFDFNDYLYCVREAGQAIELTANDFKDWKSGLSQSKASKDSRPLLEDVSMVQFKVGQTNMYFKRSLEDTHFECADFLMKKFKDLVAQKQFIESQSTKERPSLDPARKQGIIDKLCPLMPTDRRDFWHRL